ncbi:signal peptidase I [Enterococcus sp. LJL90]
MLVEKKANDLKPTAREVSVVKKKPSQKAKPKIKDQQSKAASSKKAAVSTPLTKASKGKAALAKQRKTRAKPTTKKAARSHQPQRSQSKQMGGEGAKITIGKLVIPIDKRFVLTIFSCILLAGIIMLIVATTIRYDIVTVADNAMVPVEENQKVAVDSQVRIQRYDLLAFHLSSSEFSGEYIRRVIGMPGDSIWVENQTIFINGALDEMISLRPQTYASQLPSGTYSFTTTNQNVIEELQGFSNIPSESYLVLSDTTEDDGGDSRDYGLVNARNIQGVVTYRIWPLTELGDI